MKVIESPAGASQAVELQAVRHVERAGLPFLIARDGRDRQLLIVLEQEDERLWVGRGPSCDIVVEWDGRVSGTHAELLRVGDGWAVADDGLSRNGTFVGSACVVGRRRLRDGEVLRVGHSCMTYRSGATPGLQTTEPEDEAMAAPSLSPKQRKVLICLCRPLAQAEPAIVPATNPAIAHELVLSVEAIRGHMRALFWKFGLESLPQNEKRAQLAKVAMRSGAVSPRDLRGEL